MLSAQKPDALALMGELARLRVRGNKPPLSTRARMSARTPHWRLIDLLSAPSRCTTCGLQADPNPRRSGGYAGLGVRLVIDHGVDSATTIVWP